MITRGPLNMIETSKSINSGKIEYSYNVNRIIKE